MHMVILLDLILNVCLFGYRVGIINVTILAEGAARTKKREI